MASEQGGSGSAFVTKKGAEGIGVKDKDQREGIVSSIVVKWTSEHQQGPLHWRLKVRLQPAQQSGKLQPVGDGQGDRGSRTGLEVELHVGYVERTAALAEMEARMPQWSTLSYEATCYISKWQL